jgi:hypothetical protein
LNVSPDRSMESDTEAKRQSGASNILTGLDNVQPNGTPPPKDARGIGSMASEQWRLVPQRHTLASNAVRLLKAPIAGEANASVHAFASLGGMKPTSDITKSDNVQSVGHPSRSRSRTSKSPARVSAGECCGENKRGL